GSSGSSVAWGCPFFANYVAENATLDAAKTRGLLTSPVRLLGFGRVCQVRPGGLLRDPFGSRRRPRSSSGASGPWPAALPGADDGIRTRDPHLGKVMLYQLSHVRVSQLSYRPLGSASRRSETSGPTVGRRELLDLGQRHLGHGEGHELGG